MVHVTDFLDEEQWDLGVLVIPDLHVRQFYLGNECTCQQRQFGYFDCTFVMIMRQPRPSISMHMTNMRRVCTQSARMLKLCECIGCSRNSNCISR